MLQGVTSAAQKCQKTGTPNFFGVTKAPRTAPSALHPKGAIMPMQQCQFYDAPTIFIWCQCEIAEMSPQKRIKGRVIPWSQKCQLHRALPIQFNGVIVKTQKCRDIVAPRERTMKTRSNAAWICSFPNQFSGDTDMTQQCLDHNSPRERPHSARSNAKFGSPLPTFYRGSIHERRNATRTPPPPNLGHHTPAEMPRTKRPITRGHRKSAIMPLPARLAT